MIAYCIPKMSQDENSHALDGLLTLTILTLELSSF